MRPIRVVLLLAGLSAALPAGAILIRADRDDAEYLEMATKYASSTAIDVPGGGEGVLIDPRWVLTSAQVGAALMEMKSRPVLAFGSSSYEIEEVHIYPTWRAGTPSSDLALIYLKKPVRGVVGAKIYKNDDEGGKAVVIVGHGETGKIGDKAVHADGKKRGAINTIDRMSAKAFQLLVKKPDEASDLQGATSLGDGGGPAYIQEKVEDKDELFVAGIAYRDPAANGAVDVGDAQAYVRVSAFAPWIEDLLVKAAKHELRDYLDAQGS